MMLNQFEALDQAIYKTVESVNIGDLGAKLGINSKTFSNKCRPGGEHKLTLNETINLITETKNPLILYQLIPDASTVWVQDVGRLKTTTNDKLILSAWANWEKENAETLNAISESLRDNVISQKEYNWIEKELHDAFAQELYLLQLIEKHLINVKDCPLLSALRYHKDSLSLESTYESISNSEHFDLTQIAYDMRTHKGTLQAKLNSAKPEKELNIHEIFSLSQMTQTTVLIDYMGQQANFVRIKIQRHCEETNNEELLDLWAQSAAQRAETIMQINALVNQQQSSEELIKSLCKNLWQEFSHGFALLKRLSAFKETPVKRPQIGY